MTQSPAKCIAFLRNADVVYSYQPKGLTAGIDRAIARHGMTLTTIVLGDNELAEPQRLLSELHHRQADGIIVNVHYQIPRPLLNLIGTLSLPRIWINSKQEHNAVRPDDLAAGKLITSHLIALGHRRIGYSYYPKDQQRFRYHSSVFDRCAGYRQALAEAGLEPWLCPGADCGVDDSQRRASHLALLRSRNRPSAMLIYTESDLLADATAAGLRVPENLSLARFGEIGLRDDQMTEVAFDWAQLGETAVEMLLEQRRSPGVRMPSRSLPWTLKPGITAAAPA